VDSGKATSGGSAIFRHRIERCPVGLPFENIDPFRIERVGADIRSLATLRAVALAPAARLTDDSERRPANVGWCASADADDLNQFRLPADGRLPLIIGLRVRLRYPSDRRGAR
jgi:hypothetical protein